MTEGGALGGPVSLSLLNHSGTKKVPEFAGKFAIELWGPEGDFGASRKGQLYSYSWHPSGWSSGGVSWETDSCGYVSLWRLCWRVLRSVLGARTGLAILR